MKLTEEQIQSMRDKFEELSIRTTTVSKDWEDFADWLSKQQLTQPTENTRQWIHCSERLPTKEDADSCGLILFYSTESGSLHGAAWTLPDRSKKFSNMFWTPAPKNLVKPTPPDPFEEWRSVNSLLLAHEGVVEIARAAFEAGKSQPK